MALHSLGLGFCWSCLSYDDVSVSSTPPPAPQESKIQPFLPRWIVLYIHKAASRCKISNRLCWWLETRSWFPEGLPVLSAGAGARIVHRTRRRRTLSVESTEHKDAVSRECPGCAHPREVSLSKATQSFSCWGQAMVPSHWPHLCLRYDLGWYLRTWDCQPGFSTQWQVLFWKFGLRQYFLDKCDEISLPPFPQSSVCCCKPRSLFLLFSICWVFEGTTVSKLPPFSGLHTALDFFSFPLQL